MAQFCRNQALKGEDEQKCQEQLAFPKRVARAISHRVEQMSKTVEGKSLFANSALPNIRFQQRGDKVDLFAASETPRWRKPLFSPETAAALRQKLTK
jgi:hypothetical protein